MESEKQTMGSYSWVVGRCPRDPQQPELYHAAPFTIPNPSQLQNPSGYSYSNLKQHSQAHQLGFTTNATNSFNNWDVDSVLPTGTNASSTVCMNNNSNVVLNGQALVDMDNQQQQQQQQGRKRPMYKILYYGHYNSKHRKGHNHHQQQSKTEGGKNHNDVNSSFQQQQRNQSMLSKVESERALNSVLFPNIIPSTYPSSIHKRGGLNNNDSHWPTVNSLTPEQIQTQLSAMNRVSNHQHNYCHKQKQHKKTGAHNGNARSTELAGAAQIFLPKIDEERDEARRVSRCQTLANCITNGDSLLHTDYLHFQRSVTLYGFPRGGQKRGSGNNVVLLRQTPGKELSGTTNSQNRKLEKEVELLKRSLQIVAKMQQTNNEHIRSNLANILTQNQIEFYPELVPLYSNNSHLTSGHEDTPQEAQQAKERKQKRIDYQRIARLEREEARRKKRSKKWRALWKKSIERIMREKRDRRNHIFQMFQQATNTLSRKTYARKSDQTKDSYAILCSEMQRLMAPQPMVPRKVTDSFNTGNSLLSKQSQDGLQQPQSLKERIKQAEKKAQEKHRNSLLQEGEKHRLANDALAALAEGGIRNRLKVQQTMNAMQGPPGSRLANEEGTAGGKTAAAVSKAVAKVMAKRQKRNNSIISNNSNASSNNSRRPSQQQASQNPLASNSQLRNSKAVAPLLPPIPTGKNGTDNSHTIGMDI